jgi:hypothetical protein
VKPGKNARLLFIIFIILFTFLLVSQVAAQTETPPGSDIVAGAQLYDKWFAALAVDPPSGNMPIWSRQSTNSRSGAESWRCSECHGWDYRGAEGAYGTGSHLTGFPDVMTLAADLSLNDIIVHLKGTKDPAHDFSKYIKDVNLLKLADFLKFGVIDDRDYIDPISLQVINGNLENGTSLYRSTCAKCHGEDGKKIVFRTEGIDEYLGSVANRDPWRFLHRTRFGVAGTQMPIGYNLGWSPEDGRDLLAYAQSLPTGSQIPVDLGTQPVNFPPDGNTGNLPNTLLTGILTGLGASLGAAGYSVAFIAGFLLVGVLVVTILKRRK